MTKKLEKLFDLPKDEQDKIDFDKPLYDGNEITSTVELTTLEKIENALTAVRDLDSSDAEMDTIAQQAVDSFQELMTLGMNVEARHSSEIFAVAERMLNTAMSAKNNKVNKKLKMIDLQLKKAKLDMDSGEKSHTSSGGMLMDRNELLKQLTKSDDVIDVEESDK